MPTAADSPPASAVVDVRGVRTRFGAAVVHDGLDLRVNAGEVFALVGGSGSGKSTLLREIILLQRPAAGSIRVFGQEVIGLDDERALPLRRRWGVMFERGALFSALTVAENVGMVLAEHTDLPPHLIREVAAVKIALTGLPADAGAKYPSELSGGMRKRAALARALALDPELLFLDEPTAGLDPLSASGIDELVREPARCLEPDDHDGDPRPRLAVARGRPRGGARQGPHRGRRYHDRALAIRRCGGAPILSWAARARGAGAGMENKVNLSVVGAFVIVLTVAMIAGVLWLASGMYNRKTYDTYETYMTESVSGLTLNSTVRYRGVEVGRVRQIMLAPGNVEQVRVRLEIERGTPVKTDTVATLQTQGLTGLAYVELKGGRKDSPVLKAAPGHEVPVIASAPSLMERLETSTPVLMANLTRAVDNLNSLLDDTNRSAVRSTLADLAVLTQTLAKRSSTIDAALASAGRTMENTASVSAQLPQLVQRFDRTADALERMATDVSDASASARSTLDSARGTFDLARSTLDGSRAEVAQFTGSALPEARELVAELRGLAATMHRVVDEVERNPGVLLQGRGPAKRGPGE